MAKGYWIGRIEVHDPEVYRGYVAENMPVYAKYGGRLLVRGGQYEAAEGEARARNVVLEFPSYEAARACYHSPEYQELAAIRLKASIGDLLIVEGYDGPQPGEQ